MAKDLTKLFSVAKTVAAAPEVAGSPVRNVERSPEVEKQKERGVLTMSLSLFPKQDAKLSKLADYLDARGLGYNPSLAFRAALSLVQKDARFKEAAIKAEEGSGWLKRNVLSYEDDHNTLQELARYLRKEKVRVRGVSTAQRAVLEAVEEGDVFFKAAEDLKERRDRRGKT